MILTIYKIRLLYHYNIYDDNIIQFIIRENIFILRDIFNIYKNKLNVKYLSANCNALDLLLEPEYIKKISIDRLCNVNSKDLSKTLFTLYYSGIYDFKVFHRNKINLSRNYYGIDFIKEYPRCINYYHLANNKMGKDLLLDIIPKLNKQQLKRHDNILYEYLFTNENMMEYVANNIEMIRTLDIDPRIIKDRLSNNINCALFWKITQVDFNTIINNISLIKLLDNYIDLSILLCNKNIDNISKELNFNIIDFYNKFMDSNNIPEVYKLSNYDDNHFWNKMSRECKSFDFLVYYKDKLNYKLLCCNEYAIPLLVEYTNRDYFNWNTLSLNINAIPILTNNIHKINWKNLSLNINAIDILSNNTDKIDYENLALNVNAIELLEDYITTNKKCSKIFWNNLSTNPNIFVILNISIY